MIVLQGFPLNISHIILGLILSMLFSDFKAQGRGSVPTPPIVALLEFFHTDTEINVHLLPVSRYLSSSLLC